MPYTIILIFFQMFDLLLESIVGHPFSQAGSLDDFDDCLRWYYILEKLYQQTTEETMKPIFRYIVQLLKKANSSIRKSTLYQLRHDAQKWILLLFWSYLRPRCSDCLQLFLKSAFVFALQSCNASLLDMVIDLRPSISFGDTSLQEFSIDVHQVANITATLGVLVKRLKNHIDCATIDFVRARIRTRGDLDPRDLEEVDSKFQDMKEKVNNLSLEDITANWWWATFEKTLISEEVPLDQRVSTMRRRREREAIESLDIAGIQKRNMLVCCRTYPKGIRKFV